MSGSGEQADRLAELESRQAWQDDTLEQLNGVIARQWETIDRLLQRVERLEDRVLELEQREGGPPVTPPPHY